MSEKTLRVVPANGIMLAGIPKAGADVPEAQAREWARNGLVTIIEPKAPAKGQKES